MNLFRGETALSYHSKSWWLRGNVDFSRAQAPTPENHYSKVNIRYSLFLHQFHLNLPLI
jgi:hypothetical protein